MTHNRHYGGPVAAALALAALLAASPAGAFTDAVFGPITVTGNSSTHTGLILHELDFAEGDPFDFAALDAAWEHLEDLGWFAFVDMDYDDTDPHAIAVTVNVEEDATTRYYPIIDYDPRWDVLLGARIYDINFGGRGERLSFGATWYDRHGYELDWSHPWLFGMKGLSCGLGLVWEDADFVFTDTDFRHVSGEARLRWDFRRPFFVEAGLELRRFEFETDASAPPSLQDVSRDALVWRGVIGVDSRDLAHYPTRGLYARATAEIIDRPAFYDTRRMITADLRGFVPLPWEHVLALRAWGRRVDGELDLEDRLYWGGADTIRGYDYASLAGEEGFLLSAEYRWPLFLMPISADGRVIGVGLHAFVDAGSAWWNGETSDPLYSWGAGTHFGVSDHQFRFEVAVDEDGEARFQFMDQFNF